MLDSQTEEIQRHTNHSLQLTRFAVDAAAEAMFTIHPDGRILDANAAACERLEYTHEEMTSMTVADVDPHYPSELWPSHVEELRKNREMTFETQHRSKSNRIYDVEVSVAYFKFEGVEYLCAFVRDITARKQAEHLLRMQHDVLAKVASTAGYLSETLDELCRLVEEIMPGAYATIMLLDPADGQLRFEAGPRLSDEMKAEVEPLTPSENSGSCAAAVFLKRPVIVEDTRSSKHWSGLRAFVEKYKIQSSWSVPILDERDQTLGTFALTHQSTLQQTPFHHQVLETATHLASIAIRRQRFEEQLQTAHDELAHIGRLHTIGELASSLAHELNQPLSAIVNRAYALEQLSGGDGEIKSVERDHITEIASQSLRAADIVRSVRGLAQKHAPVRESVCLNDVVAHSLELLEPELRNRSTVLQQNLQHDLPAVSLDSVQIQQIMVNLVRNAIEAMQSCQRDNRVLTIETARVSDDEVCLRVIDSGSGIDPKLSERIFEPFQTTKPQGMGMGLAICRSIAESHLGRLVACCDNQRTCFCLTLPINVET